MADQTDRLARKCLDTLSSTDHSKRVVVAVAGVPGAGKTTLAAAVASRINEIHNNPGSLLEPVAIALPMDGFHYSRAHLRAMPHPAEAIHRRGAAFTFDASGFATLVSSLVSKGDEVVYAPSFDHAAKDPVENALPVHRGTKIVLIEGLYCALNREPWKTAAGMMSEIWFVEVDKEVGWKRLAKRHLESGIVKDEAEAWKRATGTDELNAQDIRENLLEVDEVIKT